MTIIARIDEIRNSINEGKSYDEYQHLFVSYIGYLENLLMRNPKNIKAVCQLAIANLEARQCIDKSVELMENTLQSYKDELSSDELIELMTNLAFFYQEEWYEEEKAKQLLREVVKLNPTCPNPYNALGILSLNEGHVSEALSMFEKACIISDNIKYYNNYAVALYSDGQFGKALDIFLLISKSWREDEVAAKAYYSFGMAMGLQGKQSIGIEVADNLCSLLDKDTDIDVFQIADLYYICREYEKCVKLYEHEKLYYFLSWLQIYFYSLMAIGSKDKLYEIFKQVINEKENYLVEEQNDNDEEWTIEERKEYTEDLRKEIREITEMYNSIVYENFIPKYDFEPQLVYGCYLIDCPRHGVNNN